VFLSHYALAVLYQLAHNRSAYRGTHFSICSERLFCRKIPNDFIGMLLILIISIPVYICATASVPVAAVLMLKGLSPGAALVLLMAGPATIAKPTLKTVLNLQKAWKWQLLT